ncbi:SAM-dependent methyltransferase [Vulcanisaeta thermophila]|uniref:SAM-dependent methyltransferase n=1 Tax=Vulcanisaeta thermophila TaxID=867917 RepID=UPI000853EAA0|nr:SAM-dependent methyltransferase [Vulcanisaeta thermophila]
MPIYVVGAGPWDPDLITLKAVKVLVKADVVYFGSLINEEIISRYAPRARRIYMGHVRGEDHERFVREAIKLAKEGLNVVFLKNGDPTIFGRGIEICREAIKEGVDCEIVPGVSSFTAAAARYLIEFGRSIALVAYPNLEVLGELGNVDTKVVFMSTEAINQVLRFLRGDEELIVISRATYPDENMVVINGEVKGDLEGIKRPSIIIIRKKVVRDEGH